MKLNCLATLFLMAGAQLATATAPLVNTFNTDNEGWTVGELVGNTASPVTPNYISAGGNPGGFIRTNDLFGFNAYLAPGSYLGNWTAMGVSSIGYQTRIVSSTAIDGALLVIAGAGLEIAAFGPAPANDAWISYNFQTLSNTGWFLANDGQTPGAAVTPVQFASVLADVTGVRINADWNIGTDQVDLDNVVLNAASVPEPSYGWITAGVLAGTVAARRRRRQLIASVRR